MGNVKINNEPPAAGSPARTGLTRGGVQVPRGSAVLVEWLPERPFPNWERIFQKIVCWAGNFCTNQLEKPSLVAIWTSNQWGLKLKSEFQKEGYQCDFT